MVYLHSRCLWHISYVDKSQNENIGELLGYHSNEGYMALHTESRVCLSVKRLRESLSVLVGVINLSLSA